MNAARELAAAALPDGRTVGVRLADAADVATIVRIVHGAFAARPLRGAPADALSDTEDTVARYLAEGQGYLAELDGEPVGFTLATHTDHGVKLARVSVLPHAREAGVAALLAEVILEDQALGGVHRVWLLARKEYPSVHTWWARHGFVRVAEDGDCWVLARDLPVAVEIPDADAMRALGERVATLVGAGDLIIASGDLGAGKTTFTQGLGAGLGVRGPVISPTFVLARIHRSAQGGPALVHVDAYRLGSFEELEDLDLDASLADSVTLVEWGTGVAEGLASQRLVVDIRRGLDPDDDTRWVFISGVGERFSRARIAAAVEET